MEFVKNYIEFQSKKYNFIIVTKHLANAYLIKFDMCDKAAN